MFLVQILLPLYDNTGAAIARTEFGRVRDELTERFGGLTAYNRAPAEGIWDDAGSRTRDEIVVHEVMTERLDEGWWREYRRELERRFRQDVVVVRAQKLRVL